MSLKTHPTSFHTSNATTNVSSILDRVFFYHDALFSPTISTWCKAIKNGFLQSWPELTVNQVTKYTPISEAKFIGHMHAQQSNIRSTKKAPLNKNMDTTFSTPSPIHRISKNKELYYVISSNNTETNTIPGFYCHHTYADFQSINGKIGADQTGQFFVP